MFAELDEVISRFVLKEKDYLIDYPVYDLELVFVELPKFKRQLHELETVTDKWIYFLQNAPRLDSVPEDLGEEVAIAQAFAIANQAGLSREELEAFEHQAIFIQDQRGAITKATQQGIEQGIEQGANQMKIDIARRLLGVLDDEAISQTTGLSIAEIQALRI
jgi:predicted transposase/invertase (TIGR01784 family)